MTREFLAIDHMPSADPFPSISSVPRRPHAALMTTGEKMREVHELIEPRGGHGRDRAGPRRERNRQGARGARDPRRVAAPQPTFVKVNCAALPAELLESELFGFERGAFTGAIQHKPGKFEFANHGTMFLDEISEMSAPLQAKLLQVLQDGEFARLGGRQDVRVDVRVVAATNRDLESAVADGPVP